MLVVEGDIKSLADYLDSDKDIELLLSMYRQAISQENSILKYNFLYQLLEYTKSERKNPKRDRKNLEEWFKKEEPHVQVVRDDEYGALRDEKGNKISTKYTTYETIYIILNKMNFLMRK